VLPVRSTFIGDRMIPPPRNIYRPRGKRWGPLADPEHNDTV
jgi:hypothetical protein